LRAGNGFVRGIGAFEYAHIAERRWNADYQVVITVQVVNGDLHSFVADRHIDRDTWQPIFELHTIIQGRDITGEVFVDLGAVDGEYG
jgi:hypothetical protein